MERLKRDKCEVRQLDNTTFICQLRRLSYIERLRKMAIRKFGELVGDYVTVPNLKELMDKNFVIVGAETVEAGEYERLILTVQIDGKTAQYGTFSDSIKQKVARFITPALAAGNQVAVKLIEVDTSKGRKAMTFRDADDE